MLDVKKIMSLKGKRKLTMLTAYSYFQARMLEEAGIDMILVGDSLGNVMLGYDNTLPVVMEEMKIAVSAVRRGAPNTFVIADLPFLSYQTSLEKAVENAGSFLKIGANAVKLEGGTEVTSIVDCLVSFGIPVMGHIGLTPQYVNAIGGYRVQGKDQPSRERLIGSSEELARSGVFSLVLELVIEDVSQQITEKLPVPTIGIGAGRFCDGQVLVLHDMLGINTEFTPKFVKHFAHLRSEVVRAVSKYVEEVKAGSFPAEENVFKKEEM